MSLTLVMKAIDSIAAILKSEFFPSKVLFVVLCGSGALLAPARCTKVVAQDNPVRVESTETVSLKTPGDDKRYRIGPGDVLTVIVRKAPELSGPVRVDQRGMIRIPMINGEVQAACRTESELASLIATLYLEYKNNPSVEVFVTDFQSRPVAVIGAVNAPGQFRLQRQVRLLELLTFAGGPSAAAGRAINVIHTSGPNICQKDVSETDDSPTLQGLGVLQLNDTLKGKESANPFVQPGDIVQLPEADQVFVIGHVMQPRVIALKDKPITVSWAIAMAGGAARDGKTSSIRIIRETATGEKQEMLVNLKAIQDHKALDIPLLPNDIVEVGASTSKTILSILSGSVPGALSNGIVRVIP
jgi:polysaccharide biosynthesis/export protein